MSDNNIQIPLTFQDKLAQRMREQIGELLTEEDLKKLTERAVEEMFFKPRVVVGQWNQTSTQPPWFVAEFGKLAEPVLREEMQRWLNEHPDEVRDILRQSIEKGVAGMVMSQFNVLLSSALSQFHANAAQALGPR